MDYTAFEELCREIAEEKDIGKALRLLAELRQQMHLQNDETRLRLRMILRKLREVETVLRNRADPKPPGTAA